MPPTRQEYLSLVHKESTGEPYKPSIDIALGILKTAAVSFEHLTNDEHWDRFLSYVQADLEGAKKERDQALSYCGGAVGDALSQVQLTYQYYKGYVAALEAVRGLPTQIKQSYTEVKK